MVALFSVAHGTLPIKGKVTPSLTDHAVGDEVIAVRNLQSLINCNHTTLKTHYKFKDS